jgi:ribosomal protein L22
MSPAEDKNKDEVETEVVDETTLEEIPVEPVADAETTDEEAPAEEPVAEAEEAEEAETTEEEAPAEEPVAEAAEAESKPAAKPRRSRGRKTEEPPAEEAKPARKPASVNGNRPVVRAHAKYVRTSARKARLVCDHIRGKSVTEARAILAHTPRAVAEDWQKLLESAVANAEHNHELLGDDLRILSVTADEGPTLKRFQPRAMGRASRIRKRTSHLSIALTPKEQ